MDVGIMACGRIRLSVLRPLAQFDVKLNLLRIKPPSGRGRGRARPPLPSRMSLRWPRSLVVSIHALVHLKTYRLFDGL